MAASDPSTHIFGRIIAGLLSGLATYAIGTLLSPHVTLLAYLSPSALVAISAVIGVLVMIAGVGIFGHFIGKT